MSNLARNDRLDPSPADFGAKHLFVIGIVLHGCQRRMRAPTPVSPAKPRHMGRRFFYAAADLVGSRSCIGAAGLPQDRPPETQRSRLRELGGLRRIPQRGRRERSLAPDPARTLPMPRVRRCSRHRCAKTRRGIGADGWATIRRARAVLARRWCEQRRTRGIGDVRAGSVVKDRSRLAL